jgi:hypothetical protein
MSTGWLIVELIALWFVVMIGLMAVAAFQMHGPAPVVALAAAIAVSGLIAHWLHRRFVR